jgi:hypothetical protein
MAVQKIAFDIDAMLNSIDKIVARLQEFPSEGSLNESHGAGTGAARQFRRELTLTAIQLEKAAKSIRTNLSKTQEAIRLTMNELVERDASIADEAQRMVAAVESIVPDRTPTAGGTGAPATQATPSAGSYK